MLHFSYYKMTYVQGEQIKADIVAVNPKFIGTSSLIPNDHNNSQSRYIGTRYPHISPNHSSSVEHLWTYLDNHTQAWRTAHYDDRILSFGGPTVVIIVIHDYRYTPVPQLYCTFVYSNGIEICMKEPAKFNKIGKFKEKPMSLNLVNYILCKLPTDEIPQYVFLRREQDCSKSTSSYIQVYYNQPKKKVHFAVCLEQAMHDESDHEKIAAWVEMNIALGAELITLYYQHSPQNVVNTVQKYVDKGLVEALYWNINITSDVIHANGEYGVIYDCFLRSFRRAEYIIYTDMDELLIPHQHPTWHGLMRKIDVGNRAQFRFCHSYWHEVGEIVPGSELKDVGCSNITKVPVMFRRTHRTKKLNCKWTRWKNIVKAEGIKRPTIHSAVKLEGYSMYIVPPEEGLLHHYRTQVLAPDEEKMEDLVMSKYVPEVMKGLRKTLCH